MKKRISCITEYPLVCVFFAVCFGMLALYLLLPQHDYSEMENRFLQMRPGISASGLADGSFMETFETYTNEQIPFRSILVRCKAVFVTLTGSSENDGIAKGDDDYLFDKVLSTSDKIPKNIAAIKNFVKSADRDVYIAIAPTSTWINADKLPTGMPVLDEASCSNDLALALKDSENAHIINLYDALCEHDDEQLFYRTDHHWTTAGAGYAYRKIAEDMGLNAYDITQYEKNVADDFRGTHYAKYKGFVRADMIEYYDVPIKELALADRTVDNLIDREKFSGFDKYGAFMYGNDGLSVVETGRDEGRKLYIMKDSYANCLIPYLTMNYDKITVIDLRYFGGSVADKLSEDEDADILLMYNWTFVNDDNHFYKLAGK